MHVGTISLEQRIYDDSASNINRFDFEADEVNQRNWPNVGFHLESINDSSDSDFHENYYDTDDDDDQAFEINVDLGIERNMSDANYRVSASARVA